MIILKITWLGQAGLLFEINDTKIMIDPYLSHSVEKINPSNKRRMPICKNYFKINPDIILLTHNHLDHTDPETLKHFITPESSITILASKNAWHEVRKFGGVQNIYVMFNTGTTWTHHNITFRAVHAEHSDASAIGILIEHDKKNYYITGDTLYNEAIFADLPKEIDAVFLPINGVGNNMNMVDAERFTKKINAKCAIPVHWGLFDDLNPTKFNFDNKIIPEIYKEIKI